MRNVVGRDAAGRRSRTLESRTDLGFSCPLGQAYPSACHHPNRRPTPLHRPCPPSDDYRIAYEPASVARLTCRDFTNDFLVQFKSTSVVLLGVWLLVTCLHTNISILKA